MIRFILNSIILMCVFNNAFAFGWFEVSSPDKYTGWACKKGSSEIVAVHIWRSGNGRNDYLAGFAAGQFREQAVQASCESTHSNHGFSFYSRLENYFYDGKTYDVSATAIYADGTTSPLGNSPIRVTFNDPLVQNPPQSVGMIVGRDLAYNFPLSPINGVGHVGIWDGSRVIEIFNDGSSAANRVRYVSWSEFATASKVWPNIEKSFDDYDVNLCVETYCSKWRRINTGDVVFERGVRKAKLSRAIVYRAEQIRLIGATYTRDAGLFFTAKAQPGDYHAVIRNYSNCRARYGIAFKGVVDSDCISSYQKSSKPVPGVYRCDTFVVDSYTYTSNRFGNNLFENLPRYLSNDLKRIDRYNKLVDNLVPGLIFIQTPVSTFNRIKEY